MIIVGIDEVGRGALAGPLVAASVGFDGNIDIPREIIVNDSKKLNRNQREAADEWITKNSLCMGISSVSCRYIDQHGLTKATNMAFKKALRAAEKMLGRQADIVIVDAFYIKGISNTQFAFVKGDSKSRAVAAASIIAKVYRDKLMTNLGQQNKYQKYNWHQNAGYGTAKHRQAIIDYGVSPHHRKLFLKKI